MADEERAPRPRGVIVYYPGEARTAHQNPRQKSHGNAYYYHWASRQFNSWATKLVGAAALCTGLQVRWLTRWFVQLCRCAAVQVPHHVPVPSLHRDRLTGRGRPGPMSLRHSVTPSATPSRVGFGQASRIPPIPSIAHCGEWRCFFFSVVLLAVVARCHTSQGGEPVTMTT